MRSATLALVAAVLSGAQAAPGDGAPDFTLADVAGKTHALRSLKGKKAVVLLFTGIQCPRSVAAEPRLCDMEQKYGAQGAAFLAINSNRHESPAEIADHVRKGSFTIPVLKDPGNRFADLYKVEIQPTAFVLDGDLRVRYRGLIDDHKVEEFVRTHHLRDAIEAVVAGNEPAVKATEPVGCSVKREEAAAASTEVTYSRHVAPILNRHCVGCHRPGQVGPFPLEGHEQASAWSREIARWTKSRAMPPWKPVSNHGLYYNERRLTDEEIELLQRWHRNGAPEGDPRETPPAPALAGGWMLGKPDAVLEAEGGYEIPARGKDEYRCYVIKNPFDEDRWVTGVEYRVGNMRAVHHIIGYLDMSGQSERRDASDPGPGYKSNGAGPMIVPSGSLAGWAPGNMPRMLPSGTARQLRKGERIVVETHYHKTGRPERDGGTKVALYFAKEPVKRKLQVHTVANPLLVIPPDAENHKVVAPGFGAFSSDVHAFDVMPHMHLLGKEISVIALFPDGTKKDLVAIKQWDFNWQETYQFKEPIPFPKGTRIRVEAVYDNSLKNPNNPTNPPKRVRWGEETTDEMCIAFVHFTVDSEDRTKEGR